MKTYIYFFGILWVTGAGMGLANRWMTVAAKSPLQATLSFPRISGQGVNRVEELTAQVTPEAANQWLLPDIRYDSLVPYRPIRYWEYRLQFSADYAVLGSSGLYPDRFFRFDQIRTRRGFLAGCQPALCVEYVVAHDQLQNQLWETEERLRQFLGRVDNIHEAMLLARLSGFSLAQLGTKPATYARERGEFLLFLTKQVKECPRTLHRFQVKVSEEGDIKITNLGLQEPPVKCEGK